MLRVLLGILKGVVIGGAIGFAATKMGLGQGASGYLVYAAVGFVVGIVGGKAIWRQETLFTPALKGIFGAAIVAGLYWAANKVLGGVPVPLPGDAAAALGITDAQPKLAATPVLLAPILATLYGVFVEIDDGGKAAAPAAGPPSVTPKA
jgi:hypothetical protein